MSKKIDRKELVTAINACAGLTEKQKGDLTQLLNETPKYGLVWEDTTEDAYEDLRTEVPVMYEDKSKAIINGSDYPNHVIIEGENLHALEDLCYTHAGAFDVIYIDPPYNTGNKNFEYNDKFIDNEDTFKHSKWLSFMSKRLNIAKDLLSENGTIFISIDDNEGADLKLLCDSIWGSSNFVANISWQRTYSIRNDSKGIPTETEHILVYSHSPNWQPNKLERTDKMNSLYKNPDNDEIPWTSSSVTAPGAPTHQGMVYAIQHPFSGKMMYPSTGRCWTLGQDQMLENMLKWGDYELKDIGDEKERAAVCGVSEADIRKDVKGIILKEDISIAKKKAEAILKQGHWPLFYFTNKGKGGLRRKTYLKDVGGRLPTNFFPYTETGHTDEAKKELIRFFGKSPFDTPKPTRLLLRILEIASQPNSLVLDFFAGSGTTLQAAMELNNRDGGHRQCMLIQNDESNICKNVTYPRNKKVIEGYDTPKGEHVGDLHENNLRYFKMDSVPREPLRRNRQKLAASMTDMLRIKHNVYTENDHIGKLAINQQTMRYYEDNGNGLLILMDSSCIGSVVKAIKAMDIKHIDIYVYSEGSYAFDEDFSAVADKVSVYAIPGPMLRNFNRIAPEMPDETIEEPNREMTTAEAEDNSDDYKGEEE